MRQVLHIFKKDVRCFRYEILVILAMTALFAFLGAHSQPAVTQYSQGVDELNVLYHLFLPLAWWYLIAAVIHEEARFVFGVRHAAARLEHNLPFTLPRLVTIRGEFFSCQRIQ